MSLTVVCDRCGRRNVVGVDLLGQADRCPTCGRPLRLPTTDPVGVKRPAPEGGKPGSPRSTAAERRASQLGILGFLIVLAICLLWSNHWRLPGPPRQTAPSPFPREFVEPPRIGPPTAQIPEDRPRPVPGESG